MCTYWLNMNYNTRLKLAAKRVKKQYKRQINYPDPNFNVLVTCSFTQFRLLTATHKFDFYIILRFFGLLSDLSLSTTGSKSYFRFLSFSSLSLIIIHNAIRQKWYKSLLKVSVCDLTALFKTKIGTTNLKK